MAESAQSFLGQLVVARNSGTAPAIIEGQAKAALAGFTDLANTTFNGVALFAGINTDVKPITDYASSPPAANALAVANAFTTAFGVPQSNAAVANITPAAMQTFLDGAFANLFDPTAWSSTWSAAADQNTKSRISTSELVETSVNANDEAFRKLASAYTMLADLGTANLSQTTYQAVVDKATLVLGDALQGITALQAKVGTVQERVQERRYAHGNRDRHHDQSHRRARRRRPLRGLEPPLNAAVAGRDGLRHDRPHPAADAPQLPADPVTTKPWMEADVSVLLRRSSR